MSALLNIPSEQFSLKKTFWDCWKKIKNVVCHNNRCIRISVEKNNVKSIVYLRKVLFLTPQLPNTRREHFYAEPLTRYLFSSDIKQQKTLACFLDKRLTRENFIQTENWLDDFLKNFCYYSLVPPSSGLRQNYRFKNNILLLFFFFKLIFLKIIIKRQNNT